MEQCKVILEKRQVRGGLVSETESGGWQLSMPAGPGGVYRWAQLDDYMHRGRGEFLWQLPLTLELRARSSAPTLPGTWGFGLWNDPFTASFGVGGVSRRLPALPNAVWFFYASSQNYLSLRDNLPASGFLAASFASPRIPSPLLAAGLPAAPLLLLRPTARLVRRLARRVVRQSAVQLTHKAADWHTYHLEWHVDRCLFSVDGQITGETSYSPRGPLGLVIWIDNQYAAWQPDGRLAFGLLPTPEAAWLQIEDLRIFC